VRASRLLGTGTVLRVGATVIATGASEYRGPRTAWEPRRGSSRCLELGQRVHDDPRFAAGLGQSCSSLRGSLGRAGQPCVVAVQQGLLPHHGSRARAFKETDPDAHVAVLVREVNTYAFAEEDYTAPRGRRAAVRPVRPPRPAAGRRAAGGNPRVSVADTSLGETLEFAPDLLVLAAAVIPQSDAERHGAAAGRAARRRRFVREWEAKTRAAATSRAGVFACGLAAGPKPLGETVAQALAAAQAALVHLSRIRTVDTRAVARIDTKLCADCLTCVRTCPYGVPRAGDAGFPRACPRARRSSILHGARDAEPARRNAPPAPSRSTNARAGAGARRAVGGAGSQRQRRDGMTEHRPGLTILACRYCGGGPSRCGIRHLGYPAAVKVVDVPCTGTIAPLHLLAAFEQARTGCSWWPVHRADATTSKGGSGRTGRVAYARAALARRGMDPRPPSRGVHMGIGAGRSVRCSGPRHERIARTAIGRRVLRRHRQSRQQAGKWDFPDDLATPTEHVWVRVEGDTATIGAFVVRPELSGPDRLARRPGSGRAVAAANRSCRLSRANGRQGEIARGGRSACGQRELEWESATVNAEALREGVAGEDSRSRVRGSLG